MRIGFDAKRAFANFTGLGNYSRFVINALSEYYPENEYILYTPKVKNHPEVKALTQLSSTKVVTPSSLTHKLKLGPIWRSYSLGARAKHDHVDILHGLSNELPVTSPKGVKRIVTIHDLLFMRYPQLYKIIDIGIYKQKMKWACKSADKVIAVSEQTAQDLVDFLKVPKEKIAVVYQGCHPNFRKEFDSMELDRISTKYSLPTDFILNVGTIEPRKNALLIVKALVALKNKTAVPLVIVGKPTSYKNEIIEYAKKHNVLDQIIFRHDVSFEDLPKIYQLSQIFIYPSVFEGFGIPILEALCSRVPVITSKGSCFAESGGPNAIYINPNDPEELADAIWRVMQNSLLVSKMLIDGIAHSLKFEDKQIAADLMAVYQEVLNK